MEVLTERLVPNFVLLILVLSFTTVTQGQDACISQPCQNGGTCVPDLANVSFYTCNCHGEFTGLDCSSLTFEASLGISDIINHNLLPFILGISPDDLTNFNALRLSSLVSLDPDVQVSNPPKTYRWTLNGTNLDLSPSRFTISPGGQLVISGGSLSDEGEYQFFVSNEYGAMFSNKVRLKFSVARSFISPTTPINISMTENEPFLLPCPPHMNSYRVEYDWTAVSLGQQSIAMNPSYAPRILMEPDGGLLFSYVNASDFTTFISSSGASAWSPLKCSTTDLFGGSAVGPDVFFYVKSPVSQGQLSLKFFTSPSGLYTVATGDQFYLNCTAGGRPTLEILWYRNNVLITDSGDRFQHKLFNRTLRLGSLSSSAHDGSYKCVAVSGLLRIEANFNVKVIDRILPLYSREHANYDFIEIKSGKHGESVSLPCNTTGGEIKSRIWYYNGVKLQYSSKFANRWAAEPSTGTLTLSNLQLEDFGLFQCLVQNKVSEHYVVSLLVVTGAPLPPFAVNTTSCANFTTTLAWNVVVRSDLPPPVGFIIDVAYKQVSGSLPTSSYSKLADISSGSARSYVVKKLQPHHQFYFRIRSKSQVGVGLPGLLPTHVRCVTNSARPSLYPKELTGSPFPSDGRLNVSWKALDSLDWNAANCVYRLFYRTGNASWTNITVSDCSSSFWFLTRLALNTLYEIAIRTENSEGPGPTSPSVIALSGQRPPLEPPVELNVLRVDSSSFEVGWDPLPVLPPRTVDGYWIYAWRGPRIQRILEFEEIPLLIIPSDAIRVQAAGSGASRGVVTGLEPWTEYNVAVQGYNNAGLGPPSDQVLSVTTLDSKNSYYILSLRIVNENFTDELKDKSSSEFKALDAKITTEISTLYGKQPWYNNATVLYFRPGSVQAEIQLETASPNMSVVLQVVSSMDNLGNFSLDRNVTAIRREPEIQGVILNASRLLLNVTDKFAISCTVIGGPDDLTITWLKAGKEIGLSHRTKVETQVRRSRLSVRNVTAEDEGAYICQANKGNQNSTASIFIEVVPVLEIKPRSVTKRVGEKATFTCGVVSGSRKGAGVFVVEVTNKGNEVPHQGLNYTAANLQIPGGGASYVRKFVCEMSFQQDVLSRSEVAELIIIKPGAPKCPEELVDGVLWSGTAAGGTDVKPCPNGARGTVSRDCSTEVTWKDTNFVGCSSPEFIALGEEIGAVTEGFQSNTTAQQVLSQLVNLTKPVVNNTQRPPEIFGGDLVIAVDILVTLADFNTLEGNVSTEEDVENFAQVSSNLLEPTNRITWQELDLIVQGQSRRLVKAIDNYGLGVAATYNNGSIVSKVVQTKNLVMRIDRALEGSLLRVDGLIVTDNQSSIRLPAEAFTASQDSRVITVVYLTLNDVLTLNKENKENSDLEPPANTTIVSSTVDPRPPAVFNNPVKIVLQNRKVNVPVGVTPEGLCVYWRPGESLIWETRGCSLVASESDINKTTCECDHLTTFASLMDPYAPTIGEADQKALEIISIVGCSISLLAVIITIAVTLFFWRVLKSPRAKVLLNLCAAVAVSCILVISEGSARDNEVGCTVLAALLHYFLLALFCWMLCEGVLLYILLVKVFGGGAEDKVKYFYLFGWGFPVIIVAISLGASQADGYGSSEGCWLDVPSGLIWAFIAPAILIILINIVVFILVIRQMMGTRHVQNKTQLEKVKAGVKASAVILPLLGITWLFGLLSFSSSTVAFKYLFAITNSLQGLMIFIFHCLLNKQIQDAIKRRQEKSSSGGASTTPKTKPSPVQSAKHAINLPGKAPGNKKRSNRAQNDYEMMDSITSAKSDTLPSCHDNKDAIINIPDEQNITKQLPVTNALTHEEPNKQYNLQHFEHGNEILPMDNGPEEESPDEKTSRDSFLPHQTKDNGLERVGSTGGSDREDELENDRKVSVNGVANHIYEEPPDDYVPSFEEFQKSNRTSPRLEDEDVQAKVESAGERTPENAPRGPRRGGELVHDFKGSVDGVTNRINENTPDKYDPFVEMKARRSSSSSSSSSSSDSEVESVELSKEINPVINREDVTCVVEGAAPLEGALPLDLDDKPIRLNPKKVEPRNYDDSVKNDEDFDEKMTERRAKVDTVQAAADGFKSHQKLSVKTSSSRSLWQLVRQKINRGSFKVTKSRGSPDQSENRKDISDDVEDIELV